jgi:zinc/manganese transport system substrate-binding protein
MRKTALIQLLAAAALVATASGKLTVITTLADYAAVARAIGGANAEVTAMAKPTEDPHFVDARPSLIVKLRTADILIEGGAELEAGWLPPLLQTARNPKLATGAPGRVMASAKINLLGIPGTLNRAEGDVHASGNPHFMIDPIIAKAVGAHFANSFAAVDPANAEAYQANSKKFSATIDAKLQEWGKALQPFRGQHVAAYHDDWLYFGRRFGLEIDVLLEPKPGVPPSPAHLAEVITRIKSENIKAIIVEPYHQRKIAEKVASSTGASVVDAAQYPEALPNTESYIQLMDVLVGRIVSALKK